MSMILSHIVALDSKGGIGKSGRIPWHLPKDLEYFKSLTLGHYVLVGSKTWDAMKSKLPGRMVLVLTKKPDYRPRKRVAGIVRTVDDALATAYAGDETEVFVIGGGQVYTETVDLAHKFYCTEVAGDFGCDTFYPAYNLAGALDVSSSIIKVEGNIAYRHKVKAWPKTSVNFVETRKLPIMVPAN